MRILHVIPGLTHERGGPSTVLQALAQHQTAAGHAVAVLTTTQGERRGERPVELAATIAVERLPLVGPQRLAYAPGFAAALRRRLRTCDVLHVHSVFTNPVHVALREARAAGVPVVLRPCGHLHRYSLKRSAWRKRFYLALWGTCLRRACTAWHYTSEHESAESWPWDSSPRFVLPNGIEPGDYAVDRDRAGEAVRRRRPQLGDGPYVLFLGRLHPKKRLDLLLEAFLTGAPASWKLVVAGPDECRLWPALSDRFLGRVDAARRVQRVGTVTGAEKVALLAGAALFALPSEHENFGNAALEALATGTPVVLSPHVDLAEKACTAGLGLTVPLTVEAWRGCFASAAADQAWLRSVPARARPWVARTFAWDRIATALTDRYRWVAEGCPPPAAFALSSTDPGV